MGISPRKSPVSIQSLYIYYTYVTEQSRNGSAPNRFCVCVCVYISSMIEPRERSQNKTRWGGEKIDNGERLTRSRCVDDERRRGPMMTVWSEGVRDNDNDEDDDGGGGEQTTTTTTTTTTRGDDDDDDDGKSRGNILIPRTTVTGIMTRPTVGHTPPRTPRQTTCQSWFVFVGYWTRRARTVASGTTNAAGPRPIMETSSKRRDGRRERRRGPRRVAESRTHRLPGVSRPPTRARGSGLDDHANTMLPHPLQVYTAGEDKQYIYIYIYVYG